MSQNVTPWDDTKWRSYERLIRTNPSFKSAVRENMRERHDWAADQTRRFLERRTVSMAFRHETRLSFNLDAEIRFPRPDPDEWMDSKPSETPQEAT